MSRGTNSDTYSMKPILLLLISFLHFLRSLSRTILLLYILTTRRRCKGHKMAVYNVYLGYNDYFRNVLCNGGGAGRHVGRSHVSTSAFLLLLFLPWRDPLSCARKATQLNILFSLYHSILTTAPSTHKKHFYPPH